MGESSRTDPEEEGEEQEEQGGEEGEEIVSSECQPLSALGGSDGSGADESRTLKMHTWRISCTPAWAICSPASSGDDGEVVKRKRRRRETLSLSVQYRRQTPISDCGQQVWPGALLLTDWLLEGSCIQNAGAGRATVALELGAGIGIPSLVLARSGRVEACFLTDFAPSVLRHAARNAEANDPLDRVRVRHLDWAALPQVDASSKVDAPDVNLRGDGNLRGDAAAGRAEESSGGCGEEFEWRKGEWEGLRDANLLVLAADVVYGEDATGHLLACIRKVLAMSQGAGREAYAIIALAKRENFILPEARSVDRQYDHFLSLLNREVQGDTQGETGSENGGGKEGVLKGEQLAIDWPPRLEYSREGLQLWRITLESFSGS